MLTERMAFSSPTCDFFFPLATGLNAGPSYKHVRRIEHKRKRRKERERERERERELSF